MSDLTLYGRQALPKCRKRGLETRSESTLRRRLCNDFAQPAQSAHPTGHTRRSGCELVEEHRIAFRSVVLFSIACQCAKSAQRKPDASEHFVRSRVTLAATSISKSPCGNAPAPFAVTQIAVSGNATEGNCYVHPMPTNSVRDTFCR